MTERLIQFITELAEATTTIILVHSITTIPFMSILAFHGYEIKILDQSQIEKLKNE